MALTATATERVRADIITQLHLREPACYTASFNRPNLTYRISAKSGAYEQITDFLRARPGESGIIYCQARKTADSLASKLNSDGVRAAAYHAGMETDDRSRSQEAFLRDEVRVVCATIAFGMGITNRTCGLSFTTICRKTLKAITRKPAARPRRLAQRMPAALQPGRSRQIQPVHRRDDQSERARNRPRAIGANRSLRRMRLLPPRVFARLLW